MSKDYQFTQDWFHWAPEIWEKLIPLLPSRKDLLEIGSFEGRSLVWMAENMLENGGTITAIDTWEGGEEHETEMEGAEGRFDYNVSLLRFNYPDRYIEKKKGSSALELAKLLKKDEHFDFIYIDGSHKAKDVLTDACMSWPLLRPGSILVFDDYMWGDPRDMLHRPKMAVDAFVDMFGEELEVLHIGYQFVVKKKITPA